MDYEFWIVYLVMVTTFNAVVALAALIGVLRMITEVQAVRDNASTLLTAIQSLSTRIGALPVLTPEDRAALQSTAADLATAATTINGLAT